jgi:predicted  nucleic acid-binding Zn-ribbon protein
MVEQEDKDALRRDLDSWLAAYKNVDSLNERLAELEAQADAVRGRISDEESLRDKAQAAVEGRLDSIPDDDEQEVVEILSPYITQVGLSSVIRVG